MNSPSGSAVRFKGIAKSFPGYTAIHGIDLAIPAGKFLSVVGPSGCGKSTLLSMAAGLMLPSEGSVESFGKPLKGINRQAGYMFQARLDLLAKIPRQGRKRP